MRKDRREEAQRIGTAIVNGALKRCTCKKGCANCKGIRYIGTYKRAVNDSIVILTSGEAGIWAFVAGRTIQRWASTGKLEFFHVPGSRVRYFMLSDILALI